MSWMLLPPKCGGISTTFTNAFYIETIFEIASKHISSLGTKNL